MPTVVAADRTSPEALDSLEEFRVLARAAEARRRARSGATGPRLRNGDRMARLHAIADNPYVKAAFGDMTTLGLMRVCAEQLAAAGSYKAAAGVLNQIAHHENLRAALAAPESEPGPEPEPEPQTGPTERLLVARDAQHDHRQFELAVPEPADPPRPRRTAMQVFVAGLSDRELAQFMRVQRDEEANPPPGPRLEERLRPYLEARGLHDE